APQLENTGIWVAEPTGICHTSAYREGEYVHQGCVYDDQGGGNQYRWFVDTLARNYTYPEAPAYRRNAADIVEVRVKPLDGETGGAGGATAFRVTLNTMTRPDLYALTLALGDGPAVEAPHGTNTLIPAQRFVTVHGEEGEVTDAATGEVVGAARVRVDVERRQVEIRVPHAAWTPRGTERVAAAAGLWDAAGGRYLVPQAIADETHPGGAIAGDPTPSAFFDAAFRVGEPFEAPYRDRDQKLAIARGDLSPFAATVDFGKLRDGVTDDGTLPTSGYVTRIFASAFETAQGRRLPSDPGGPPPGAGTQQGGIQTGGGEGQEGRPSFQFGWPCRDDCVPDLPGRLQRYTVYVPERPAPADGYPSVVWTNGYALRPGDDVAGDRDLYRQFADRPGHPTMVIDVDARGNDGWGYGQSGAAVLEALADARRHYDLDPERTTMAGFSSGAYMANKLSLTFPDVFTRAFVCDGLDVAPSFPGLNGVADTLPVDTLTDHEAGSKLTPLLPSRRNQPVMEWAGTTDDFIPYPITRERADAYLAGDYDVEFVSWAGPAAEHLVMCKGGLWDVATRWLGDEPRAVDPHHVTYVRNPLMDDPESGLVGDHAYWLSGITTTGPDEIGRIDVVSHGRGVTAAPVPEVGREVASTDGHLSPVNPYLREFRHLDAPVAAPAKDLLEITGTDVTAVTVDPEPAGVGCGAELAVTSNVALRVTLLGCGTRSFDGSGGPGTTEYDPADPLAPLDVAPAPPLPGEVGNVPQAPLYELPPLRIPPNQPGQDPAP
ncbi:MAG: hypothetical protein AB7V44_35485, partial [Pseudonocardia sp.]